MRSVLMPRSRTLVDEQACGQGSEQRVGEVVRVGVRACLGDQGGQMLGCDIRSSSGSLRKRARHSVRRLFSEDARRSGRG